MILQDTFQCNCLTPLHFKGLRTEMQFLVLSLALKVKFLVMSLSVIPASLWAVHRLHILQYSEKAQLIYLLKFSPCSYICSCRTNVLTEWSTDAPSQRTDVELCLKLLVFLKCNGRVFVWRYYSVTDTFYWECWVLTAGCSYYMHHDSAVIV